MDLELLPFEADTALPDDLGFDFHFDDASSVSVAAAPFPELCVGSPVERLVEPWLAVPCARNPVTIPATRSTGTSEEEEPVRKVSARERARFPSCGPRGVVGGAGATWLALAVRAKGVLAQWDALGGRANDAKRFFRIFPHAFPVDDAQQPPRRSAQGAGHPAAGQWTPQACHARRRSRGRR